MKRTKVLLVDDHPLILEGYKNVLKKNSKNQFIIETSNDLASTYLKITNASSPYDLVCLDMNMPAEESLDMVSGEDLALFIRKNYPEVRILVMTMSDDNFRLFNILKTINPEGFLIKKDIKPNNLVTAFNDILEGKSYYSHTVTNLLRKQIQSELILDSNDRKILYFLSKGLKTKDLPNEIPLSLAAIEKRKRIMKEAFQVEIKSDLALVIKAKDIGFL
ncbi:response regulator [Christiangramia marina]|uniref:response regulator n=1 Tax=Christiangramia marina TaxID=409436 RepID=UPI003AA95BF5